MYSRIAIANIFWSQSSRTDDDLLEEVSKEELLGAGSTGSTKTSFSHPQHGRGAKKSSNHLKSLVVPLLEVDSLLSLNSAIGCIHDPYVIGVFSHDNATSCEQKVAC
ncbi:UNVERIFIED_CONTAM: hypothetical protein Sangu_2792400 [Sesamum angustifolium]|uniref:Uncharacterized protein n=1 Tax=Sesamum angustifolium TaxID=2727405 RepID=A0AAW2ISR5_9LAMI